MRTILVIGIFLASVSVAFSEVRDIDLAEGAKQRLLILKPPHSRATLVMFPGGSGKLEIGDDGRVGRPNNFLIRTRDLWLDRGFTVVIPDVPSNHATRDGLFAVRFSANYLDTITRIVRTAEALDAGPVWLVGTSQGTNAVVAGAATLPTSVIAGSVLTSSLTRPGTEWQFAETVFQGGMDRIIGPVLIVAHRNDECEITPPSDVPRMVTALTSSVLTDVIITSGTIKPQSGPCDPLSAHGFFGTEASTIDLISAWLISHSPQR